MNDTYHMECRPVFELHAAREGPVSTSEQWEFGFRRQQPIPWKMRKVNA